MTNSTNNIKEGQEFVAEWSLWADRLLSAGAIDPPKFARAVDAAGLDFLAMPTVDRQFVFEFLRIGGRQVLGARVETLVDILAEGPVTRDQAERAAHAYGTAVNVERFAGWVREFSIRARIYHALPLRILDHSQSIGDICRQVMEDIGAIQRRSRTTAA